MAIEVAGINLDEFKDPIKGALTEIAYYTNGEVEFDIDAALDLTECLGKSYSAKSTSQVIHMGEKVTSLTVVVFAPGEGTGNEDDFKLKDLDMGEFPWESQFVPRSKAGIFMEACLSLAAKEIDKPNVDPVRNLGSLTEVGFDAVPNKVVKLGTLGQPERSYLNGLAKRHMYPKVTFTTAPGLNDSRLGDPHAVVNIRPDIVQVAAFLSLDEETANTHKAMFTKLEAGRLKI
jgi:hypothetical protein